MLTCDMSILLEIKSNNIFNKYEYKNSKNI